MYISINYLTQNKYKAIRETMFNDIKSLYTGKITIIKGDK